ncbi:MAG TPA: ATP-binding protein [Chloroflexota bacterium]|nr:ATP-binding protein [Chloroflexota bacterium]
MGSVLERRSGWRAIYRGVRGRLLGSYAALVFVLLVGLSVAFSTTQVLRSHFTHTVSTVDVLTASVAEAVKLRDDEETGLRGYLLTGDRVFLQPYSVAVRALPALHAKEAALLAGDASGRVLLTAMWRDAGAWQAWAAPLPRQPPAQVRGSLGFVASMVHGKVLFDRLRQSSSRLTDHLAAERERDLQDSLTAAQRSGGVLFWVLIGTVGLGVVIAWLTTRGITRSLNQLAHAATVIGHGELGRSVVISGAAEFARLGQHLDQMRQQLHTQRALAELLGSSLRLDTVWTGFAGQARKLIPFDHLSLSAIDSDGIMITTLFAEGLASECPGVGTKQAVATTSASLVQPDQRCLLLPDLTDVSSEPGFEDVRAFLREGLRSKAILPLRAKGRVVGSLTLGTTQTHVYTEELLGPVLALVPLVGAAMENARLYSSLDGANTALESANRELGAFAYSVSHDLRAPLRSISGFSQAILEDYADRLDEEGKGYLRHVIGAGNDMGQLIDGLLRLSRVTRADLERQPTDLSALARTIIKELERSAPERRVTFALEERLVVEGDTQLLRVLLDNLLGNAWKFTRSTPAAHIELGVTRREGRQIYFVRDNGAGFDMAYAGKLFGAFQRLHSGQEFEGTGIGLATVQRIVHRHGGQIWAEGVVGEGAIFYFTLSSTEG